MVVEIIQIFHSFLNIIYKKKVEVERMYVTFSCTKTTQSFFLYLMADDLPLFYTHAQPQYSINNVLPN